MVKGTTGDTGVVVVLRGNTFAFETFTSIRLREKTSNFDHVIHPVSAKDIGAKHTEPKLK